MDFDPRQYQDTETSQQLKKLRRHCHLANEALKSVHGALPNWGKILSNLDVASNQLQLFEDQLNGGDVVLQKIAVPMRDVREEFRPSIPVLLDTTKDTSTIDAQYTLLEQSSFDSMSNTQLEERRRSYNNVVNTMAVESLDWRNNIKDVLLMKKQQEKEAAAAETGGGGGTSGNVSSSSLNTTTLGKRQRENMQRGLEAFSYIGEPSFKE